MIVKTITKESRNFLISKVDILSLISWLISAVTAYQLTCWMDTSLVIAKDIQAYLSPVMGDIVKPPRALELMTYKMTGAH